MYIFCIYGLLATLTEKSFHQRLFFTLTLLRIVVLSKFACVILVPLRFTS